MPRFIRVSEIATPRELVISDSRQLVTSNITGDNISIMDIKLGLRSFRHDYQSEPQFAYFTKYDEIIQVLYPER